MRTVLDIETTFEKIDNDSDPSPYNHLNALVLVVYHIIETGERGSIFFNHNTRTCVGGSDKLQEILDKTTMLIGHNLKFDMSWLYECGYKYTGKLWDTMIFEYMASKGRKVPLSLAECALRYGATPKLDIFKQRMKEGLNTNEMDADELEEYALGDIQTTLELYEAQRIKFAEEADIKAMWPSLSMAMETLGTLINIERAGIKIDTNALDEVEHTYRQRKAFLEEKLQEMVRGVMGDTPVNLSSSDDMCAVVYSIRVKDKATWIEQMNIGSEMRGAIRKKKYLRRKTDSELRMLINKCFTREYRTHMEQCPECHGKGHIMKFTKKGEPYARPPKCKRCEGTGVVYTPTTKRAGFKIPPINYEYVSASGFSTDKETISDLVARGGISPEAQLFLEYSMELSAVDVYLTSFVEAIRKSIRSDGLCHPNFNQTVTATGRLSSSKPNWQNQPRAGTFPIKKSFISRFVGGKILNADFAALEYRTAVALAECPAGIASLERGDDRHALTAAIIFGAEKETLSKEVFKDFRQKAKSRTFRPLYGGTSGTEAEKNYNKAFFEEHVGIASWHERLCEEALNHKQITIPSGRSYAFPDAARKSNGSVVGKTQIVNYPVQGFASAEIAWCVFNLLNNLMITHKCKSKLILQVHDSISADVHPDEFNIVIGLFKQAFDSCADELYRRFKFKTPVEFTYEMDWGNNALETTAIDI